uniref:HECT domain-containing protein n=1 Tax=Paramormyrops kingsleyae TaxID=1676925 RepID=A0A3B3TAP3_9TELE
EAADELALMGALRHLQSLDDSKQLMEAVLHFYLHTVCSISNTTVTINFFSGVRLREGLSTLGVLEEITLHPQAFEKIFLQDTSSLKASDLVGLFQYTLLIKWNSPFGFLSYLFFYFFSGGLAHPITLEHVLIFATGLRRLPAMGFEVQPELAFLHAEDGLARFPKANTCSLVLYLPVGQTYNEFKNNMDLAVGCAHQFGEG